MKQYLDLLEKTLNKGHETDDRTGVGTYELIGPQMRFELNKDKLFPAITTKKMYLDGIIHELIWFLKGKTNIKYLVDNGVHIWDDNAYNYYEKKSTKNDYEPISKEKFVEKIEKGDTSSSIPDYNLGDCGPVYGKQWRNWEHRELVTESAPYQPATYKEIMIDQIQNIINGLENNPYSRRHILSAWNPAEIDKMALPPCHIMCQFKVQDNTLHSVMYQRSADAILGVPFNITSYSLLTAIIAEITDYKLGTFTHDFGSFHIYKNHHDAVKEQLSRDPKKYDKPKLKLQNINDIDNTQREQIEFIDYESYPKIEAEMNV